MRRLVFLSGLFCVGSVSFAQSFVEDFEVGPPGFLDTTSVTFGNAPGGQTVALGSGSWYARNASTPIGTTGWYCAPTLMAPNTGAALLNANFNSVVGANAINSFFMSPPRLFAGGDTISFWTRTSSNPATYPDRLTLTLSGSGSSTMTTSFTLSLLTVNPTLTSTGFPSDWTQYTASLPLSTPVSGRFAFHYDVPFGGPTGTQSDFIGIDDVTYTRAGLTESFDTSSTTGFIDNSVTTFGNSVGGNEIVFPSGAWHAVNVSTPVGASGWFNGSNFSPRSGVGQLNVNFQSTLGANTISNYMMSPVRVFTNGDRINFWTRTVAAPFYAERLNLRLSTDGPNTNPAAFNRVLLTINPSLLPTAYPTGWTEYSAVVSGLSAPAVGRFAFHYDVPNGGPAGTNSDYIGIDDVSHTPAPASQFLSGFIVLEDVGSFAPGLTRTISYTVRQGSTIVAAGTNMLSAPGFFYYIPVPFAVSGPCTITFDGSSFLKKNKSATLTGADQFFGSLLMVNGDVDKSGEVDAADIDAVIASFGSSFPGPGDPDTDVDVSGEVDAADIDIVIANFGSIDN